MDYLLTVIIPNRNITDLLQRCLDSIPRRDDIQIIIVDDASDIPQEQFDSYPGLGEKNVEVIFTKEGRGAGYARNVALEHARGRWLMFVDSDDFLLPSALSLIDRYAASDKDIIYFNIESRYSDSMLPASRHEKFHKAFATYSEEDGQLEKFLRFGYTEPWGKMIRRVLVSRHGIRFDESPVANDYMFSVVTGYYAAKVELCMDAIVCVTMRDGSLCADYWGSDENTMNRLKVYAGVQRFFDDHGIGLEPLFRYMRGLRTSKKALFGRALEECSLKGYSKLTVLWRCLYGYVYSRIKPRKKFC